MFHAVIYTIILPDVYKRQPIRNFKSENTFRFLTNASSPTRHAADTAGKYYIRNMSNNHAMDVLYGSMNNGQYVVDYEYNGGINQQWQLVPTKIEQVMPDGYYEIRSAVSGKNLEVYGVDVYKRQRLVRTPAVYAPNVWLMRS